MTTPEVSGGGRQIPLKLRDTKNPGFASVEEYVEELDGTTPIKRILIANNGISAVKAIRSIRRWAYEVFQDDKIVSCNRGASIYWVLRSLCISVDRFNLW